MDTINLIWLRRDLRITDNQILSKASEEPSLVFFIWDNAYLEHKEACVMRASFLHESLTDLSKSIEELDNKLRIFDGNSLEIITELIKQVTENGKKVNLIFSREAEVSFSTDLDKEVTKVAKSLNCEVTICDNNFLLIDKKQMDDWRAKYYSYQKLALIEAPPVIPTLDSEISMKEVSLTEIKERYPELNNKSELFKGGETEALKQFHDFLSGKVFGYHWKISRPWLAQQGSTSHLSPHIYFGTISTRYISQKVRELSKETSNSKLKFSLRAFLDRIRWRDSFTQRLYFHPEIIWENRHKEFDAVYKNEDLSPEKQKLFTAWQEGQTGFPMVDASMRELKKQGWINFRMRAMCATFLTINCGISWHHGADHFMKHLIDADYSIDNWQWQMQAGITNPLSETFRIYNPTTNLKEKDEKLEFVHYWIPELRGFNLKELLDIDWVGKTDYPEPILNWSNTRKINGKIISDLRKKTRERIIKEKGPEFEAALVSKKVVEKYYEGKNAQYKQLVLGYEQGNEGDS